MLNTIRPRFHQVNRFASRLSKTFRYGFDLVLWSRLLNRRRSAIPVDLPARLLKTKGIFNYAPTLYIDDISSSMTHWEEGFQAIYATLFLNLQNPDILSKCRYAHPAPSFNGIYLWDSVFIAQIWKHWDRQAACDIHQSITQHQEHGRLQHVVATFAESIYTQPPLLSWGVKELSEWFPADAQLHYVEAYYENLKSFHQWLRKHREVKTGLCKQLYFWDHPYESGIDNSPRFSNRDESEFADTRQLASPDLSAYVCLQCESLRDLANLLNLHADATYFDNTRREIVEQMNLVLWDEKDGLYYDRHQTSSQFVRSSTIASFLPLWAGVPDLPEAERLRSHLIDSNAYNTLVPFPTVSLNDPEFSKDMWRGPVWINTAYAVLQGMQRYHFNADVATMAYRLCDGVYRTYINTQKMHEFYDPQRHDLKELHRKKGNQFKQITLGSKPVTDFVGWTGLVNVLVIETLLGLQMKNQQLVICPNLPEMMSEREFSIRLPEAQCTVAVERRADGSHACRVRTSGGQFFKELTPHESWTVEEYQVDNPTSYFTSLQADRLHRDDFFNDLS